MQFLFYFPAGLLHSNLLRFCIFPLTSSMPDKSLMSGRPVSSQSAYTHTERQVKWIQDPVPHQLKSVTEPGSKTSRTDSDIFTAGAWFPSCTSM